jgi:hypothetical protein
MAGDSLHSARIKLKRAELHYRTAMREGRRFFRTQAEPTFQIQTDRDLRGVRAGEIFAVQLVVVTGYPDPPDSFSARFGDALHNYRGALDHIAWQLVCKGTRPPSTLDDRAQRKVQFPIYDAEAVFRNGVKGRLPGVAQPVIDFIHSRHEYVGGQATNDALLSLAALSNDDKHRTLHFFSGIFETLENQVTPTRCVVVRYENPPMRPAVKDNEIVALMRCQATGPNPELEMNLQPTIHIAMEDGRDFTDVLEIIGREVRHILSAPEIAAAV